MADPVIPPSTTALPTGAGPATLITVPTTGQSTNATTPGLGYPPWLLQAAPGGYIQYGTGTANGTTVPNRTAVADTGDTSTLPNPIRLYQLKYLFGVAQSIPSPTTPPPDHTSCCHAIFFLLLCEAQKLLWNELIVEAQELLAAPAPSTDTNSDGHTFSSATPAALPAGGGGNGGGLDPEEAQDIADRADQANNGLLAGALSPYRQAALASQTIATSSGVLAPPAPGPLLQACVASMRSAGTQPDDVQTYIQTIGVPAQQALLAELTGVVQPVDALHGSGVNNPHGTGGAMDIEYQKSPFIPLMDTIATRVMGDGDSYHGFTAYNQARGGTPPLDSAYARIYKPCLDVWDRASGGPGSNQAQTSAGINPSADADWDRVLATTLPPLWALDAALRTYFAQTTDQVTADRAMVAPGMVLGDVTLAPQDASGNRAMSYSRGDTVGPLRSTFLGQTNPTKPYGAGILGFNRILVQKMTAARLPTIPPTLKDSSGNAFDPAVVSSLKDPAGKPYMIRWSVFTFGADLMHFDVVHPPGVSVFLQVPKDGPPEVDYKHLPPRADMATAQKVADAFIALTSNGQTPWGTSS